MSMIPKRSMVFIDGSNLSRSFRQYCLDNGHMNAEPNTGKKEINKRISYENLMRLVTEGTDRIRGYYYDGIPPSPDNRLKQFHDKLRGFGITVITKPLHYKDRRCPSCNHQDLDVPYQKGIDIALVTEVMNLGFENAFDVAIIISGDNDFEEAINHVKRKGKQVWVAAFQNSLGGDIRRSADKVIVLDKIFSSIVL